MPPAIQVENLGKRYRINHAVNRASYKTLRESLIDAMATPWRNWRSGAALGNTEEFWALEDLNFDVQPGEVVGVIGRNGAGKSTLLKILSRITKPTTGSVTIHGRVASLLEVGTGFNLELSGRENIYLSGAILGMGRREIDRKLEEIIEFSGIERFIDTPVKRYSSGMTVRLGFAVAAHLEPEILIVDEVLAVGDVEFQSKCLGKMQSVSGLGRTVVFVSHNMNAVAQLCQTAMLLEKGRKALHGDASQVIDAYLENQKGITHEHTVESWDRHNRPRPFYTDIQMNGVSLPDEVVIAPGEPLEILLQGDSKGEELRNFRAGVHISTRDGIRLMSYATQYSECGYLNVREPIRLQCNVDSVPLLPGMYYLDVNCGNGRERIDYLEKIATLRVKPGDGYWPGQIPVYKHNGYFAVNSKWFLTKAESVS